MEEKLKFNDLQNEKVLVELAKTDDAAFEILYNHYFPKIYGFIFKRTGRKETTEDLVSEIFLKVFCNLEKYRDKGCPFGAWVFRIATNSLFDHYRYESHRKSVDIEAVAEPLDPANTADAMAIRNTDSQVIRFVLGKLSDKYQKILVLKFFEELEYTEISQVLDISINNARVILSRALTEFESLYKKYVK